MVSSKLRFIYVVNTQLKWCRLYIGVFMLFTLSCNGVIYAQLGLCHPHTGVFVTRVLMPYLHRCGCVTAEMVSSIYTVLYLCCLYSEHQSASAGSMKRLLPLLRVSFWLLCMKREVKSVGVISNTIATVHF